VIGENVMPATASWPIVMPLLAARHVSPQSVERWMPDTSPPPRTSPLPAGSTATTFMKPPPATPEGANENEAGVVTVVVGGPDFGPPLRVVASTTVAITTSATMTASASTRRRVARKISLVRVAGAYMSSPGDCGQDVPDGNVLIHQ